MSVTIAAVMRQINNFFEYGVDDGRITISGNKVTPVPPATWICIKGSRYHDGVWRVCGGMLQDMPGNFPDEDFDGRVWFLAPPPDFLALYEEIVQYDGKNPTGALQSESFGGYSYTRPQAGGSTAWQDIFAGRLSLFRGKPFTEVY